MSDMSTTITNDHTMTRKMTAPILVTLMGAMALPSLAIDMYLPSLPEIGVVFEASVTLTQLSLTAFLVMLGIGQLIAGPITDAVGRRRPLLIGCAVFIAGSLLAALAPHIAVLLAARIIQGAGGALVVVVANSSVRDYASGDGATRLYALMLGIVGVAPIIAPAIGGFIDTLFGWRSIFWLLTGLGVVLLLLVIVALPESLDPSRRSRLQPSALAATYRTLLSSPRFILPGIALIAMFGLLFTYIGGSSYVYQGSFGLSSGTFGLAFGATGIAMMLGTLAVNRLSARFQSMSIALVGGALASAGTLAALLLAAIDAPFPAFLSAIVVMALGFGLAEPALMGQAMSASPSGAGQAAALLGSAQFLLGAAATVIAGLVAERGALPWAALLTAFAVCGFVLTLAGTRFRRTA